ncbi:hypothetical protein POTOM_011343 [Populus tomentosa]|uniref:Uncharacterized protein n=1 Tax=Populus tomentosa TaxID=118781 RepID=A0A8X8D8T1_POPTO|nr:hypothetical protein POTOM_011343 [Populus tomentosa]
MLSQVKTAHQLLKTIPHSYGSRRVDGVPVFSKQNSDIAIATKDRIKWYLDDLSVLDYKMWEFFAEELSDVPE